MDLSFTMLSVKYYKSKKACGLYAVLLNLKEFNSGILLKLKLYSSTMKKEKSTFENYLTTALLFDYIMQSAVYWLVLQVQTGQTAVQRSADQHFLSLMTSQLAGY